MDTKSTTKAELKHIMPQSHCHVIDHVIFSTKDRRKLIKPSVRSQLHLYMPKIVRELGCECYRIGGVDDHVHLAIRFGSKMDMAKFVEKIKVPTSQWMKRQTADLQYFAWQRGYGAFSISPQYKDELLKYIDNQEEHHRIITFQEEFLTFLRRYEIPHDERYLWD